MNENTVTISTKEYKELISAKFAADQLKNLLESRAKEKGRSIYSDEVETICLLFGIQMAGGEE